MGLLKHLAKRGIFLLATLILAIYLTVVIANGGGLIDEILKAQIENELRQQLQNDPAFRRLPLDEQQRIFNETYALRVEARGLNQPFIQKSFTYTIDALTLNLGHSLVIQANDGSNIVSRIIAERLPRTLVLFTVANAVGAVAGIWLGLWMAKKALSAFDRGATVVSITTTVVPPWIFGIFFILVLGYALRWFPTGGWIGVPAPPGGTADWYFSVAYHMMLPLIAFVVATFGTWAYTTRNLVLQIMDEDFVNAARARGLPERMVLNKYVLRAASPPIVTSLALTLIVAWQGAIITETVFNYQGIGQLFYDAISVFDAPIVIGLTALYAYLLVATVFALDIIYSFLDPRVRAVRR